MLLKRSKNGSTRCKIWNLTYIGNDDEDLRPQFHKAQAEHTRWLKCEQSIPKQKANIRWLDDGDSNTKYFYAVINEKRKRAYIQRIQLESGLWISGEEDIANEAVKYFSDIFKEDHDLELQHLDCINQRVTQEDNIMLDAIPDEEEIKTAVFYLNPDSSPGPDGFGGAFYQSCWNIIKSDLIEFIQQFFGGTGLTRFYTSSCLILLPKVESPSSFNDMRPISLSNRSNKIISKIMSSRLNTLLPKFFLKINLVFSREDLSLKMGLKQGDPLSPSFFILGAEVLSIMLNQLPHINQYRGFSMPHNGPQITHLTYSDDVIIFSTGGKKSLMLVMHQLQNYQKCSGQKININKSCFLVDSKASTLVIHRIKQVTGYRHSSFPITYLGCPLYIGRQTISLFSDMVSKLVKRTTGWQGKLLSVGSRATLIKHVLQSQPIYLLSALEPPKDVLLQLESYMCNCFWETKDGSNKYHWSSWDNMCYPKEEVVWALEELLMLAKV
ncbi:uncharacterized protein LOC132612163 [Lycium barbarum]|uniref:uncharacterized protein LOC132612163 n=1 Tax=Lycium barbarum TaxID=112863 RepID=UPI00293E33F4|nr:uncharacterized protein LOC132612163 [Lycium barbarum]